MSRMCLGFTLVLILGGINRAEMSVLLSSYLFVEEIKSFSQQGILMWSVIKLQPTITTISSYDIYQSHLVLALSLKSAYFSAVLAVFGLIIRPSSL